MKTKILVRAEPFDTGWIAAAYGGRPHVIVTCQARSEDEVVADLGAEDYLATEAMDYLTEMGYAGDRDVPSCPVGFIKQPVDLWGCKVKYRFVHSKRRCSSLNRTSFSQVACLMNLGAGHPQCG